MLWTIDSLQLSIHQVSLTSFTSSGQTFYNVSFSATLDVIGSIACPARPRPRPGARGGCR
jgi:hypothetical protein